MLLDTLFDFCRLIADMIMINHWITEWLLIFIIKHNTTIIINITIIVYIVTSDTIITCIHDITVIKLILLHLFIC